MRLAVAFDVILLVIWLALAFYISRATFRPGVKPWLRTVGVVAALVAAAGTLVRIATG